MEKLKTLLIANRGEIAVRIIKTAKKLGIKTISVYTEVDSASTHVREADEVVLLREGPNAYTDGDLIIKVAKEKKADAIIPGYGFLSENAEFAKKVKSEGIQWVGPSPEAIDAFGIKHVARELAEKTGVPAVPGTKGLVADEDAAVKAAEEIGFPVMLKATGGGGGMGLITATNPEELRKGFTQVQSRGEALFKNPGVFIERFYSASRHIEVQVFGNGQGKAIHFGERECSIQRRHQKVIEECPSPFVSKHPELRKKLGDSSVALAESIKYGSAGTVEYLVDDMTGDYFFLEMNTRLQVEHGITELCYGVDLVELMLRQADAELAGKGGLDSKTLDELKVSELKGAAIEARVYAENPLRGYAPSPGLLQKVKWHTKPGSRIDTWVFTGSRISPNYDPLVAKVMFHADTRDAAIEGLHHLLRDSVISGPPTNLELVSEIMEDSEFKKGDTLTSFLQHFKYHPPAIDVVSAGAYTLIQDLPARPTVGRGIPHSGPMDPVAFQIANFLAGNPRGKEGLEITLSGPELRFLGPAVVALTGAAMETTLDGKPFPMWTRVRVVAGQTLKVGKTTSFGCRSYLAVHGGFPAVAEYFNSKSTSPLVAIGGYQGRALAPGDLLLLSVDQPESKELSLPEKLRPKYTNDWQIAAMSGPHDDGYLLPEDLEMLYSTKWKVSHNASRSGIRLVGPVPKWARKDGGEGGAHPSNLIEFGYPIGTLNWTGDDPCIFPVDCPNFGGFVSSTTIIRSDWWKLGQIKAGDQMKYQRVNLEQALELRHDLERYLNEVSAACSWEKGMKDVKMFKDSSTVDGDETRKGIVWQRKAQGAQPTVTYRQGGDDFLLVEYGEESFDLNHRCRVTKLVDLLRSKDAPEWLKSGLANTVECCNSTMLFYNGLELPREKLISHLQALEDQLGDLSSIKVPTRRFKLPISFESKEQDAATLRYMETQRPHAPYLPSNLDFVARNNALEPHELKKLYLTGTFMTVVVGFFCGNTVSLPVDPRQRLSCPKQNPSRVYTPEGSVSWGGSCMSIYPVDSPGGYQMTGRTLPCFDTLGYKKGFSIDRPWYFNDFDLLTYYQVSEDELADMLADYRIGNYEFEYENIEFDMKEHNDLLQSVAEEVKMVREKQAKAQEEMVKAENESLARWREEKAKTQVDEGTVEKLLQDPAISSIEAPVDANVWKILVEEGEQLKPGQTIVILEAMKLEINVNAPDSLAPNSKVEKMIARQSETVKAGEHIALIKCGSIHRSGPFACN